MSDKMDREIILKGIGVSPGICIGKAYLVDKEGVDVVRKYFVPESRLANETNRFKAAVKNAKKELEAIIGDTPEVFREHSNILETHVLLLNDKMLYGRTIEIIEEEKINAEWALKNVVSSLKRMFRNVTDPYLRERSADIVHVSDMIMRNLSGADQVDIKNINKRVILVADDLSPAETSQIMLEKIMGFATDLGGRTSHTGIIARTLEIPAVLGLGNVTRILQNDQLVVVDGSMGILIVNPEEETLIKYTQKSLLFEEKKAALVRGSKKAAMSLDGVTVSVMGNIELPEEVVSARHYGGEGIGLFRTEFQYLSRSGFPSESELFDKYRDVVEVMGKKPVTIRTLDINGDKSVSNGSAQQEPNPALGLRAIRYCLKRTDVFRTQLRAILHAAAFGNVRILLPMISNMTEIEETKKLLEEVANTLESEGIPHKRDIPLGIMIEVPSAVVLADIMIKEVDFFSIGTNDLIQYTLGIDRGNREVEYLFDNLHPAVIRMIKRVSDVAAENDKKVFMCGEMAGDPRCTPILLGFGIDELSMNPPMIPSVKKMIRLLNVRDCRNFVKKILDKKTGKEISDMLEEEYGELFAEVLFSRQ